MSYKLGVGHGLPAVRYHDVLFLMSVITPCDILRQIQSRRSENSLGLNSREQRGSICDGILSSFDIPSTLKEAYDESFDSVRLGKEAVFTSESFIVSGDEGQVE